MQLNNVLSKCFKCKNAPCVMDCPLHHNIPEIISLYNKEEYEQAFHMLFDENPLFGLCGILCPYEDQCAKNCNYYKVKKERIEFNLIEEDLAKRFDVLNFNFPKVTKGFVLVIGAGPAGLVSSIKLRQAGFKVTLIEKENKIGGVVTNEIPKHRFNSDYFVKMYDAIKDYIDVKLNTTFGKDVNVEDFDNYNYVVVATGCDISNGYFKNPNVYTGIDLLKKINKGLVIQNKKIAVLGCGNVGVDCATSLKLMGNDVEIYYRRKRQYAPMTVDNQMDIDKYEIPFHDLFVGDSYDGKNLVLRKMKLLPPVNGEKPGFEETDETITKEYDVVIESYGSKPDYSMFNDCKWLSARLDNKKLRTRNYANIYFAGDAFKGASTIVKAIADGIKAVKKIIANYDELTRLRKDLEDREVVYGGSFNPITVAHQEIIDYIKNNITDNIVLLPNGNIYPRKELLPFEQRVELIRAVYPDIYIDDYETKHAFGGSVKYLEEHNHPFFVIGADSLKDLPTWIDAENLIKDNRFIVFSRGSTSLQKVIDNDELLKKYENHFYIINTKIINVSSTIYRETLDPSIVDEKVHEIVMEKKLYTI